MKQTKKITRRQREFLEKHKVKDIENLRLVRDNNRELVVLNTITNKEKVFIKEVF